MKKRLFMLCFIFLIFCMSILTACPKQAMEVKGIGEEYDTDEVWIRFDSVTEISCVFLVKQKIIRSDLEFDVGVFPGEESDSDILPQRILINGEEVEGNIMPETNETVTVTVIFDKEDLDYIKEQQFDLQPLGFFFVIRYMA